DFMTVSMTPERFTWLQSIITQHSASISRKLIKSTIGVFEFLASVLTFLRAPLGWLQRRVSGYGCINATTKLYGLSTWDAPVLQCAFRIKTISSTHLEIFAICSAILSLAKPGE